MNVVLLFPGQGSQKPGMGKDLVETLAPARDTFAAVNQALGESLSTLCFDGPADTLTLTHNAQPALLAHGAAVWAAVRDRVGPHVRAAAGHSLGEFTAYQAADALELTRAARLVRRRGELMLESGVERPGTMAAILGDVAGGIEAVCARASAEGGCVVPANYNSPGQVVIAGDTSGVNRAMELARAQGAKRCVLLAMSVPSHCSLMRPAAERLRESIQSLQVRAPSITFLNDVDAASETAPERIRDAMTRQLYNPVRWVQIVQGMAALGATQVVECGPGGVLTGVNRRAAPEMKAVGLKDAQSLTDLMETAKN